jgi:hypothetical protein
VSQPQVLEYTGVPGRVAAAMSDRDGMIFGHFVEILAM